MVEHLPSKQRVAGSSPVSRSRVSMLEKMALFCEKAWRHSVLLERLAEVVKVLAEVVIGGGRL